MTQFHVCAALPAFAAERLAAVTSLLLDAQRRAAIDRYFLPTRRSAANSPHATAAVDRWDRQTDGRTDTRAFQFGQKKVSTRFDSRYRVDFFSIRFHSAI